MNSIVPLASENYKCTATWPRFSPSALGPSSSPPPWRPHLSPSPRLCGERTAWGPSSGEFGSARGAMPSISTAAKPQWQALLGGAYQRV